MLQVSLVTLAICRSPSFLKTVKLVVEQFEVVVHDV